MAHAQHFPCSHRYLHGIAMHLLEPARRLHGICHAPALKVHGTMEKRHVTLAEAAAIAGTSLDTIRRRLRKGELEKAQTNQRGIFVDLASLREAFDLPADAGQDETAKTAEIETALKAAIKGLEKKLSEMRLAQAQSDLKHRDEVAGLETRLAVAAALAEQRQAEVDRLHGILTATATQVPGIEERLASAQEGHLAELKALQERMERETNEARSELAAWRARPWWRRIAG
ncbi:hypothetical protein [Methylobacterium oxalidis]|uniref:hypothetical protein n=1 Tax=Methylobacterium oxalidis TaxID=944322 RepID=UPI003314A39D